jgi:hypothetical protein
VGGGAKYFLIGWYPSVFFFDQYAEKFKLRKGWWV